ncbi:type II CAAX endopeptidase family protein [Colwellia sp. E2M01]|uniref:CPBP family intramembrane glutamic endopeptidase n=1 Tax=Colwellia sp. E2M01 TaxID=2841561 RepID=UPI001C096226|nr:type II CAAX endopeptidase family protein [Colwellia sp. E2M01]MBU2869803.1 CPBP family intramembrane metalloprotease [Colwellia sp. E2M01]
MKNKLMTLIEKPNDDFPYYNDQPCHISGMQWLFVIMAVFVGFFFLVTPLPYVETLVGKFVVSILFFAVPLASLIKVAPTGWRAIFRKVGGRDIVSMFFYAFLNIIVTLSAGVLVVKYFGANANELIVNLGDLSSSERVVFFIRTIPQLFGEEVFSILIFLGVLQLFSSKFNCSRCLAVFFAWLVCAIAFGAIHLPTYGWNVIQAFVVIGSSRLILTLAYIKTKNIWVSTGAHIINDWTLFGLAILGASRAAG